jgi:hypothetical protein
MACSADNHNSHETTLPRGALDIPVIDIGWRTLWRAKTDVDHGLSAVGAVGPPPWPEPAPGERDVGAR